MPIQFKPTCVSNCVCVSLSLTYTLYSYPCRSCRSCTLLHSAFFSLVYLLPFNTHGLHPPPLPLPPFPHFRYTWTHPLCSCRLFFSHCHEPILSCLSALLIKKARPSFFWFLLYTPRSRNNNKIAISPLHCCKQEEESLIALHTDNNLAQMSNLPRNNATLRCSNMNVSVHKSADVSLTLIQEPKGGRKNEQTINPLVFCVIVWAQWSTMEHNG